MPSIDIANDTSIKNLSMKLKALNMLSKQYFNDGKISWADMTDISRLGLARRFFAVGDTIDSTYTVGNDVYPCPWIVVDFDSVELEDGTIYNDVPILMMQYLTHEQIQYDAPEKFEATEEIAQAGYHYVGLTVTSSGGSTSETYTNISTTAGTTVIPYSSYTAVYKTDLARPSGGYYSYPMKYGLDSWEKSFVRQYLNNSGTNWASTQHLCDVLPSGASNMTGFQTYMPSEMIENLSTIKVITAKTGYDPSGNGYTYDMFWIPSQTQILSYGSDGHQWEYFVNSTNNDRIAYSITDAESVSPTGQAWLTRTADSYYQMSIPFIDASGQGSRGAMAPSSTKYQRPCCALI